MSTGRGGLSSILGPYPRAWAVFLAGPIAWCVNLESVYVLTLHSCAVEGRLSLHLSTLACLAVAILGAVWAGFLWASLGRGVPSDAEAGPGSGAHFLSVLGLIFDPFFAMLILSQWLAIAMLDPCSP